MGIYDRDWYKEEYKKKEAKYGSDFSRNSKIQFVTEKRKKSSVIKTVLIYVAVIAVVIALVLALRFPSVSALLKR